MPERNYARFSEGQPPRSPRTFIALGIIGIIVGIWALASVWGAFESGETGQVGVIRNGGPFDNKEFRGVLPPNAGPTWIGFNSSVRYYPSTERYDNFVPGVFGANPSDGDTLAVNAYRTNTRDGMSIGIKGQFKYTVNQDPDVLAKFDQDYGQRTYAQPNSDQRLLVSDGDDGFAVFLDSQVRPLEEETIRQIVGDHKCTDFDASCTVLTQGNNADPAAIQQTLNNAPSNSAVFQDVANRIGTLMEQKLTPGLGAPYLQHVTFLFTGVDLPQTVRDAINRVQTAGAGAAEAQANAARATAEANGRAAVAAADATANENKQRGYLACPVCADLDRIHATGDAMKSLPPGLTTYIPGGGVGLNLNVPGGR